MTETIKIKNVVVITIPHNEQRYNTIGDWVFDEDNKGTLVIRVSELGDWRYGMLVALHEFIEAILCNNDGVGEAEVTKFDLEHLNSDEPGAEPTAPYNKQHIAATVIEEIVAKNLQVDWERYENAINETSAYSDAT